MVIITAFDINSITHYITTTMDTVLINTTSNDLKKSESGSQVVVVDTDIEPHLSSSKKPDLHEQQRNGDSYNNKPTNDPRVVVEKMNNNKIAKFKKSAGPNGVAMQRWQILAKVLGGKKKTNSLNLSPVSVRRFNSFSLLKNKPTVDNVPSETDATWHEYTCPGGSKNLSINIRLLPKEVSFDSIFGFNNTGNVCIWPSEEVLAYYCLKHSNMFSGKRICELGGGMTCLAGICVAAASNATHVQLTDGNENSVKNVHHIVKHNRARNIFGNTDVHARCLRWGTDLDSCKHLEKFDYILSADCLFFEEGRMDLIDTIDFLLKPGGEALVFAPTRKNSFNEFLQLASSVFFCSVVEKYDDVVWKSHLEMLSQSSGVYEKDLHYPILLLLQKTEAPTE